MSETPTKWEKIVPKRVEQVVDALRKLTRTGAKDYEPIPAEHAEEMLTIVRNAVAELEAAYAPYIKTSSPAAPKVEAPEPPAAPAAPAPRPEARMPNDPLTVARFVHQIPKELLPSWAAHLSSRITDEFYETFKGTTGK